ncbi:MAG: hypothetical protein ACRYG8_15930 [Janthinobacterium lividum]
MQRFKSARHVQRFLSARSRIHNHFSFAATVSPPTNTVLLATAPFAPGATSPELVLPRELGAYSGQLLSGSLNLPTP